MAEIGSTGTSSGSRAGTAKTLIQAQLATYGGEINNLTDTKEIVKATKHLVKVLNIHCKAMELGY